MAIKKDTLDELLAGATRRRCFRRIRLRGDRAHEVTLVKLGCYASNWQCPSLMDSPLAQSFRAHNGIAALAPTPVLREATTVGPLSALLRRSRVAKRPTALDPQPTFKIGP